MRDGIELQELVEQWLALIQHHGFSLSVRLKQT